MATRKAIPRKAVAAVRKMQKEAGVPPKERVPASYHVKDKAAEKKAAEKKAKMREKLIASSQRPMMHDVMVDLETTGQGPGCAILSIGAVFFREDKGLGAEYHQIISLESCAPYDLKPDPSTMKWWSEQSEEARKTLLIAQGAKVAGSKEKAIEIWRALNAFGAWLEEEGPGLDNVRIWGNGADFDNAILAFCYKATNRPLPWKFWNNRCFRTLKALAPRLPMARAGTHHNALDDAKTQAAHAIKIMGMLSNSIPVA